MFDPIKETKEEREARLNAVVKKALKSIRKRDLKPKEQGGRRKEEGGIKRG